MESEKPQHLSPEIVLQEQGYFTPESLALAQTVDNLSDRVFKKWRKEDE